MAYNRFAAFNLFEGDSVTPPVGTYPNVNSPRFFSSFAEESATIPDLALTNGDVFEFDVCCTSTDNFNEFFIGATSNDRWQLNGSIGASPSLRIFNGGTNDTFSLTDNYAHGCWNKFKVTISSGTLALECNGVAISTETVTLPLSITTLKGALQAFIRNIRLTRGGTPTQQYDCAETNGAVLVNQLNSSNNGSFAAEPRRFEFTNNANIWEMADTPSGAIKLAEYDSQYLYSVASNKSLSATIYTGQSLSVAFCTPSTNNSPTPRLVNNGYSSGNTQYAGNFSRRHQGYSLLTQRDNNETGSFTFTTVGKSSTPVAGLSNPSDSYTDFVNYIASLKSSLTANNDTVTDFKIPFIQGEADRPAPDGYNDRVGTYFNQLKSAIETEFPSTDIKFYRLQIVVGGDDGNAIQDLQTRFDGTTYGVNDTFVGDQWSIYAFNPNLIDGSGDGVHLSTRGYQMQEEKIAEAINNLNWVALTAQSASADITNNATSVNIVMNVQTLPLSHDSRAEFQQNASKNIFMIRPNDTEVAANSVVLSGNTITADFGEAIQSGSQIFLNRANIKDATNWTGLTSGQTHTHYAVVQMVDIVQSQTNTSPTANAGPNQTNIAAGATVTLDGSSSTDTDGTIASYAWTQTAGDTVTLSSTTAVQPTFTAPTTNANQTMTFSLVVTDNGGATSVADTVDIGVLAEVVVTPAPTITLTQSPTTPTVGQTVTFTATTTNTTSVAWTATGLTLSSSSGNSVTATAVEGNYSVTATATGGGGNATATVSGVVQTGEETFNVNFKGCVKKTSNALYEKRDQKLSVTVYDTDGVTIIPASTYLNAQYRIFPTGSCTPIVSKSLGSGIAVSGQLFSVTLDKNDITVNGINGEYRHVFVVGETADEVLPNIIDELVDIIPGCTI